MGNFLTVLFAIVISLGFLCFFPIRNAVKHRGRPWATWGLIAANVAAWLVPTLDNLFGGQLGLAAWFGQLAFREDFSRSWTLVTSQFVHAHNPFQLLISLWLLYLIAPVLEEHLKPFGLLALYVGGGASAAALFGALSLKTGAQIYLAGMSPGFNVLLGLYLVLYPFEEIIFFYNFLFFTFCGSVRVATFFLVLFAVLAHGLSGAIVGVTVLGFVPAAAQNIAWLDETVPLLGLGIGFLFGSVGYGLGAFVGKSPVGDTRSPADRMVERALTRMMTGQKTGSALPGRRLSRRERSQSRLALADEAPPEEIEAFAEQCLRNERDPLLETAYVRFRSRFPNRCFGPGLQSEMAGRFEQTNRLDLAADAYRLLLKSYGETPVGVEARLRFARLLARDPTAVEEAIKLIEDFLHRNPSREAADEARGLLDHLIEEGGRGRTYEGLGPYKPFHFSPLPGRSRPRATPAGAPSQPAGLPIGWSAAEITGASEPGRPAEPVEPLTPTTGPTLAEPTIPSISLEAVVSPASAPAQPPLPMREVVPDSNGCVFAERSFRPASSFEIAAAMTAAQSYAVILLPGPSLIMDKALALLSEFWMIRPDEAAEHLRRSQGLLLDDAPSGRSVVLARKMRGLGLPVTVVPLLPDLVYATSDDVFEFTWNDSICSNAASTGRRSFGWEQIRLVNLARVGLPGAGAAYRLVLDLFVAQPHCHLRYWESTVNFGRSSLGGQPGAANALQSLVEYLDRRTPRTLKTPSFRTVAKKVGPPLDFHSPAELDHGNRWFLYAGFGKYSAGE
jgi:hypothetical protein